ncbi:TPA: tail fiber protein [Escherichia coli]|nr:phage tail protein [Escherichia coli]HAN6324804.1 phage tail protein [Escherichia coli]HCN1849057.1 tail fiber protein [Escherichia coli]HCN3402208.1 tail fiber protein [Escherichia coli]
MSKLLFTMTDAGRQELVNANKTGTNKVEIVSVGLGSRYYVTSTSQTNITDEIKRLTTIGGKVVSPDTIHVTAKDDSKDEYVVHTIGLYTNKGTLFAVYSQEQAIINKASSTIALISSDIAIKTLDTKNITFGDIEFINPPATETVVGVARFANEQEIDAGTDDSLAVSAKRLKQAIVKHEQSRNHPDATLTSKGFVQLSSATNSTSETLAATPKAVKAAYDLANAKYTAQDATTARKGIVQLSSATNSDSETLAATPKAVKAAYDLANAKYTAQDATTARKGIVQLSSATNSTSETLAATSKAVKVVMDETNKKAPLNSPALSGTPTTPTAPKGTNNTQIASTAYVMAAIAALVDSSPDALNTLNELAAALGNDPNFATTMTNALAGKQPKDATLTALAGLATAADRFPYFTGNDTASLATLTKVGRDILAQATVSAVIEYLGLQETVNKAGNAVQRSGDKMTGELKIGTVNALRIFDEAFGLIFRRSEDFLHFIPTAEGQGENGDIGPLRPFAINLRTGAISVSHGAKIEGGLAIGATDNALGENSIVLGDNDTGFRQDGDGFISIFSNGSRIGHIDELGLHIYKDIESNGSNFRLKSNYRHHITFANEDGSIRMFLWKDNGGDGVHINNGSDGGGDFIFKRDGGFTLGSGAQVASSGDIYGSVWENNWLSTWLHNHVVRDIRLGSIELKNVWRDYGFGDASGYVLTAAMNSNADDIVDTVARRPIQKLIGGIWYNVGSV